MVGYDNSRYTYEQVLKGNGSYKQDSNFKYSSGVETMQTKLNKAGFWCDRNSRFYLDAAKRRGYAQAYYDCIDQM